MLKGNLTLKRLLSLTVVLIIVFSFSMTTIAASTIETYYAQTGPYSVSTITVTGLYNDTLVIYYPTNMTSNHPIVTWGNGTYTNPTMYSVLLRHVASYGFVVVCSYGSNQGTGTKMINAAQYMVNRNGTSSSIFYNKLDVSNIGSMGHSQGACGAVNAATNSSLVKTCLSLSLVSQERLRSLGCSCDVTRLGNKPTLLFSGQYEGIYATIDVTQNYYNRMVARYIPSAMAVLRNSGHNECMNSGDPSRFKGYVAAWLLYQLKGNSYARRAFAGTNPEIKTNTNWIYAATSRLP